MCDIKSSVKYYNNIQNFYTTFTVVSLYDIEKENVWKVASICHILKTYHGIPMMCPDWADTGSIDPIASHFLHDYTNIQNDAIF